MSFFRKDDGWFSDYTTGDYRAHTCLRYQYCCHVVLALECFVLTCIRLWFRMTFHVSFPIFWNGFMVIWFENDFFMLPGTGQRDSRHTWLARKHWGPMEMWWFIMRVGTRIKIYTRRIHGTGIFTYIWVMFMIDVGYIYIPYVDPMGYIYICTYIHIIDRNVEFESEAYSRDKPKLWLLATLFLFRSLSLWEPRLSNHVLSFNQWPGDSWMYPYQPTPMGNPYISPM